MLKNGKVFFVTLKSWSGRKLLDPTTYLCKARVAISVTRTAVSIIYTS